MDIAFEKAGIGSAFFHDYISGALDTQLYAFRPDYDGLAQALHHRHFPAQQRQLLVQALHNQYGSLEVTDAVRSNIHRLADANTFTITTGHQLCLYTGPLYFIYKIVSVIALSRDLNRRHPGHHFIPVYWMNSEDHDFDEINHFHFLGQTFSWEPESGRGGPVGHISPASLASIDESLLSSLTNPDAYIPVLEMFRQAYTGSATLAEATRKIANALFGAYGLVVLDQDDAALKASFAPLMLQDMQEQHSFQLVNQTIARLETLGYEAQVNPREINFFYTATGKRERWVKEGGDFAVNNTDLRYNARELQHLLQEAPQHFSPNVVTRPLYQEFILPNIAYIGGPAEVHYWLQYKALFEHYGISFPVLLMRDSFLLLPSRWMEKSDKLGLTVEDYFRPEDELINAYIQQQAGDAGSLHEAMQAVQNIYAAIITQAVAIDKTLEGAVKAEEQKALNSLQNLESRMVKALKNKNDQQVKTLRDLRARIFPSGTLQERRENILSFTPTPSKLVEQLLGIADPLHTALKVVQPEV